MSAVFDKPSLMNLCPSKDAVVSSKTFVVALDAHERLIQSLSPACATCPKMTIAIDGEQNYADWSRKFYMTAICGLKRLATELCPDQKMTSVLEAAIPPDSIGEVSLVRPAIIQEYDDLNRPRLKQGKTMSASFAVEEESFSRFSTAKTVGEFVERAHEYADNHAKLGLSAKKHGIPMDEIVKRYGVKASAPIKVKKKPHEPENETTEFGSWS